MSEYKYKYATSVTSFTNDKNQVDALKVVFSDMFDVPGEWDNNTFFHNRKFTAAQLSRMHGFVMGLSFGDYGMQG